MNGNGKAYFDLVMRVLAALAVAGVVGLYAAVQQQGDQITRIEASRFTAEDGRNMERAWSEDVAQMKEDIAVIKQILESR